MKGKNLAVIISISIIIFGWLFLEINGSYQLSFKAKFYYEIGNFQRSLELSQRAFELDKYNKMANTLLNQSRLAIKFSEYISLGDEYLSRIKSISQNKVTNADRERIRLMCDVMIEGYDELKSSPLLDDELKSKALRMRDNFIKLKNELF
ncbi:hypothetical protein KDD93_04395 [Campylobacter sp. faydin G-24]|uniref:Tetratricopeptide repeat protein n=1 Tax=Campylobacter anatolicus TaxID=2829105 RepID=A0ABS5HHU2_9BACT|nr:hypothetical protein [Campylobacter anatolicus]MBR8462067.1 hypothetical protein [Campylobacter anatolicus]MBR8463815.1 hypothetical protein [Campylobacter anatolicus]MBR8464846.1 hypothetical protein [Campylobacter anatolicus]